MRLNLRFPFPSFFFLYHYVILESYFLGRVRVFFFFSWPISFFLESYFFFLNESVFSFFYKFSPLYIVCFWHEKLVSGSSFCRYFAEIYCMTRSCLIGLECSSHKCVFIYFSNVKKNISAAHDWRLFVCLINLHDLYCTGYK